MSEIASPNCEGEIALLPEFCSCALMRIAPRIFLRVPNACVHTYVHAYVPLHVSAYWIMCQNSYWLVPITKTSKFFKFPIYFPDSMVYSVLNTRETRCFQEPREVKMLSKNQVSNLITFYYEHVDETKKHGSDDELDMFEYYFNSFLECIECDPVFEEDNLVDITDW